ncbi:DUF3572 family protein [uncultured Rhodoblastus sp.]|uniref:DUF3572 family protein n=1 Tax=uncultured Rhodoblastus sp. TaxID=543037 RepID=UPI0025F0F79D|nr:DUF3572 family protein [uncultured Rhodoblastus sp.]
MAIRPPNSRQAEREAAEAVAVSALNFIALEPERLSRFLALSGLDVDHLRAVAAQPGFLAGVLAYLADDEALLLEFAAVDGLQPEAVASACRALNPSMDG